MSSMKIGIDAVLLGAWTEVEGVESILEVGCGCGVISLMLAQRTAGFALTPAVDAIDIHVPSVAEASDNFRASPWAGRLNARVCDFMDFMPCDSVRGFDLIISNPPYFDAGIDSPDTPRLKARHQAELSPESLIRLGSRLLSERGVIALVVPFSQADDLVRKADSYGLLLRRRVDVRGHDGAPFKRSLLEFSLRDSVKGVSGGESCLYRDVLTLEKAPGIPTPEHHALCRDFYLRW